MTQPIFLFYRYPINTTLFAIPIFVLSLKTLSLHKALYFDTKHLK